MDNIKRFEAAAGFLPPGLRDIFMSLGDDIKNDIREIRLRSRRPVVAVTSEGSFFIAGAGRLTRFCSDIVLGADENEIEETFRRLCGYSVHSYADAINSGYITVSGGSRAGVAGTAVTDGGKCTVYFDVIVGKIANDRTARTLQLYVSGAFGEPGTPEADSIAIALLLPNRLEDQYCFLTPKAVECLTFEGSKPYGI